jgi:hypothetical protein
VLKILQVKPWLLSVESSCCAPQPVIAFADGPTALFRTRSVTAVIAIPVSAVLSEVQFMFEQTPNRDCVKYVRTPHCELVVIMEVVPDVNTPAVLVDRLVKLCWLSPAN